MKPIKLNLRTITFLLAAIIIITGFANAADKSPVQAKPNALTKKEKAEGFKLLFDGTEKSLKKNFKAAVDVNKNKLINTCWIVQDGIIICAGKDKRPKNLGGSIVTKSQYSNFDFRIDYKLVVTPEGKNVNSGIKYFAYPNTELGLEYQLYNHDAKVKGPHALADLYDLLPATSRKADPPGKWNTVRIVARGNHVEHYLNGVKVLEYERGSERFRAAVAKSKFKNREKFGEAKQGHILLQDHGGGISFRNIKIRILKD